MYRQLIFPLLKLGDAESVHDRTIQLLDLAQKSAVGRSLLRVLAGNVPGATQEVMGLSFPNRLGVAAGFDKDVRVGGALALLGFGHIEVGTITPEPQQGNSKPRIYRLPEDKAIINRMGFPNCGAKKARFRLKALKAHSNKFVLGVSFGKQKSTPLELALSDYLTVMESVFPFADYLAINVSSPNTPELRQLQGSEYLDHLLKELSGFRRRLEGHNGSGHKPLLLKIAPDLGFSEIDAIIDSALRHDIDGIIATNTTIRREGLESERRKEAGGLSGKPLADLSNKVISHIHDKAGDQLVVIGVGGIFNAEDARKKISSGASLIQVYTGLVYEGPRLASRILQSI